MEFKKIVTDIGKLHRLGSKIVQHNERVMRPDVKNVQQMHDAQHLRIGTFKRNMKKTSVNWFNNEYSINKHWTGLD